MNLTRRHLLTALPALGAVGLGVGFARMLHGLHDGRFNPRAIQNPLLNHPIPQFAPLSGLAGRPGISREDILTAQTPILLLVWASWCLPCLEELPFIRSLAARLNAATVPHTAPPLRLWGLCYKDQPNTATEWLERANYPFERVGMDIEGRAAIEWGVTGVPESFLILPPATESPTHATSRIFWHSAMGLTEETYQTAIRPYIKGAP